MPHKKRPAAETPRAAIFDLDRGAQLALLSSRDYGFSLDAIQAGRNPGKFIERAKAREVSARVHFQRVRLFLGSLPE